jgi:glutamine amidotransferase
MITVIDYGRGNLFSLDQALKKIGVESERVQVGEALAGATKIILPGVGAFGDAMQGLQDRGFVAPIRDAVSRGIPMMGICVGMQLLFTKGEEFGTHEGLSLVPGTVLRLPDRNAKDADRIPNVGWRKINPGPAAERLGMTSDKGNGKRENEFYFVHSFAPVVDDAADIAGTITFNEQEVAIAVSRGSVSGVQFHPEKSGEAGLAFLKNFIDSD